MSPRANKSSAGDLLSKGWLPPNAAADALGITVKQLERRARNGEIKRRELVPGSGIHLYEVLRD